MYGFLAFVPLSGMVLSVRYPANSENFARILFSPIALKGIFATLNFAIMAYFTDIIKLQIDFAILQEFNFSRNFAYAKFRENKTLAKISEFTVVCQSFR